MKKSIKMTATTLIVLFLAIVIGICTFTYLNNARKERDILAHIKEYTNLGVDLPTLGEYCDTHILKNIPKAISILQSIDKLSKDMPKDSEYHQFVLMQTKLLGSPSKEAILAFKNLSSDNALLAYRTQTATKQCRISIEQQKYRDVLKVGTKINAEIMGGTSNEKGYDVLARITDDVWDSSHTRIIIPAQSVIHGIQNASPVTHKIIIVWTSLNYYPNAELVYLSSKDSDNVRYFPFVTMEKGMLCNHSHKYRCLNDGNLITISVNQTFTLHKENYHKNSLKTESNSAQFSHSALKGANFTGAQLKNVRFDSCDLTNVQFKDTDLSGAVFIHCKENGHSITKEWLRTQGVKNVDSVTIEP